MIALIVIGVLFLLIALILFLPVNVFLKFDNEFYVKVNFAFIKLFETKPEKKKQSKKTTSVKKETTEKEAQNSIVEDSKELFSLLRKKYGFVGAVRSLLGLFGNMLAHIKKLLRHIKVKKVILNITVSGDDAAVTAINYGKVCAVAYPVLSALNNCASIGLKEININSDFSDGKNEFNASLNIKLQILFLFITAYRLYSEYKKFILKENSDGR